MLTRVTFIVTIACYVLATLAYVLSFYRPGRRIAKSSRILMLIGLVSHGLAIGTLCLKGFHPLLGVSGALNLIAWLLVFAYLLSASRWRLASAGTFIVPISLLLIALSWFMPRDLAGHQGARLHHLIGRVHLILVILGVSAFALAAAVSLIYLAQERALRANRPGLLYGRTPPLATLDRIGHWLIGIAFPIYSLAIVSGVFWLRRLSDTPSDIRHGAQWARPEHWLSAAIWLIFGMLVLVRSTVGISGKRGALLTLLGFCASLFVLGLYTLRYWFI